MSFMLTKDQVRARTKTVTRRDAWHNLRVDQPLVAVEKSQGLKPGEAIVRMAVIRPNAISMEPLRAMLDDGAYGVAECVKEGFPSLSPAQFVEMFCDTHKGVTPDKRIRRIAFDYMDAYGSVHQLSCGHWRTVLWVTDAVDSEDVTGEAFSDGHDSARDAMAVHFANWPFAKCMDAVDSAKLGYQP